MLDLMLLVQMLSLSGLAPDTDITRKDDSELFGRPKFFCMFFENFFLSLSIRSGFVRRISMAAKKANA